MRPTRESINSFHRDHSWVFKAVVGTLIAVGITGLTALVQHGWDLKLDVNRYVLDSIHRSRQQHNHLDSLLHEALLQFKTRR